MTVTQGMTDNDPNAAVRRDVCQFADERVSDLDKLGFVHELLKRPVSQQQACRDGPCGGTSSSDPNRPGCPAREGDS